jgi:hypothetical protein
MAIAQRRSFTKDNRAQRHGEAADGHLRALARLLPAGLSGSRLLDAGIIRLRPVMITVGATVLGLVPLATHGGPLWEPLCYAQIGGLTLATFITLLLVPVLYSIFVLDLKVTRWEVEAPAPMRAQAAI